MSEINYVGDYPDMPEFSTPWEVKAVQVGQGSSGRSFNGEALESEGFSKCSALIIKNSGTNESALFHIDELDLGDRQVGTFRTVVDNFIEMSNVETTKKEQLKTAAGEVSRYLNPKNIRRDELAEELKKINQNKTLTAAYIVGNDGRDIQDRLEKSLLEYLGIPIVLKKVIDSGRMHWAIVYKPDVGKIYIDLRSKKKVAVLDF